jgi:ankyrin repeat protein
VTLISPLSVPCICFQDGRTPFHDAAGEGQVDAMKYLVELGAKYDDKNNVSESIFIYIYLSFLQLLIKRTPLLFYGFQLGATPLHFAAIEGSVDAMKYIVGLGANHDVVNVVSGLNVYYFDLCILGSCFLTVL